MADQSSKIKILVVEDHFINQELMREMLDRLNYTVDTANNGREAIEQLQNNEYDVIFMDLQMPEMDGVETTKRIRQLQQGKQRTPIIALTANVLQSEQVRCVEAGMDDYLSKPFEVKDIEKLLNKYCNPGA